MQKLNDNFKHLLIFDSGATDLYQLQCKYMKKWVQKKIITLTFPWWIRESYLLSVFMSPPPLSWWQLLVLMMGMLWLVGAEEGAEACSSSESLLLEPSSLLEDEEPLESEELSLLLSWSMTRASAINSVDSGTGTNKDE